MVGVGDVALVSVALFLAFVPLGCVCVHCFCDSLWSQPEVVSMCAQPPLLQLTKLFNQTLPGSPVHAGSESALRWSGACWRQQAADVAQIMSDFQVDQNTVTGLCKWVASQVDAQLSIPAQVQEAMTEDPGVQGVEDLGYYQFSTKGITEDENLVMEFFFPELGVDDFSMAFGDCDVTQAKAFLPFFLDVESFVPHWMTTPSSLLHSIDAPIS